MHYLEEINTRYTYFTNSASSVTGINNEWNFYDSNYTRTCREIHSKYISSSLSFALHSLQKNENVTMFRFLLFELMYITYVHYVCTKFGCCPR